MDPTVLFVSANETSPWGASERNWALPALHWLSLGARVHASVKGWSPVPAELAELEAAGCVVHRRWEKDSDPGRETFDLPWTERRSSTLEAVGPDLVVVAQGDNYEGLGWMEECARKGYPYVVYSSSGSDYEWCVDSIAERLNAAYNTAVCALFVSESNRHLTELQIGGRIERSGVVRAYFHVPFDVTLPWPESDGVLRLACPARLDPTSKGQDVLFDVLSRPKWRERPCTLSLFGSGPHERVLRSLCRRLELTDVEFAGYRTDVQEIWREHHALVLCSRSEGLPAVIVEAMLCGRPSIVTDVAGNTEMLDDGDTGFVAAAPVAACLDDALERAWARRDEWPEIGRRAARHIRTRVPRDPVAVFVDRLASLVP